MMKSISIKQAIVIIAFLGLAIGSGSTPSVRSTTDYTAHAIPHGVLANKSIKIVAADGSFTLEPGKRFDTPFSVYDWNSSTNTFVEAGKLVEHAPNALAHGGKAVLIYQDGYEKPLHGVLAFNQAIKAASGPASRSYMINIPEDKLQAARDGLTAVAYEKMKWEATYSDGSSAENWWYAWAIWISAYPL
ncbi:Uncharacterised protein [BD1-7 clade bacterium]|uniref:Uncharacterized protein n=1 Tax=BD1-7 clade bacterium TaxID=2029982 RepID=A0A5S9PLJ0_9GAMM|nr:Uncharacterised protein [BD1-7 clade bacterium]